MLKILLLCRYFDPEVSGGARRPKALAKSLESFGHEVKIAAPKGADFHSIIEVPHPSFPVKGSIVSSKKRIGLSNWLRINLLLPDPEIRWSLRLVKYVKNAGFIPDIIISTSPPESLHIAAWLLKRHFNCKWAAEFRDAWIDPPQRVQLQNPIRAAIERIIAKAVLKSSDGVIAVSRAVMDDAKSLAPEQKSAIIGHFALRFAGTPKSLGKETFNIVHTGSMSLSNPLTEFDPFLLAFEEFVIARPEAKLYWAGRINEHESAAIINSSARENIELLGEVSADEARSLQMGADALLLVSGAKSHALPGKYSEYILTGLPIIAFGEGKWRDLMAENAPIIDFNKAKTLPKAAHKKAPSFIGNDEAKNYEIFLKSLVANKD